jgi:hypothetical protein
LGETRIAACDRESPVGQLWDISLGDAGSAAFGAQNSSDIPAADQRRNGGLLPAHTKKTSGPNLLENAIHCEPQVSKIEGTEIKAHLIEDFRCSWIVFCVLLVFQLSPLLQTFYSKMCASLFIFHLFEYTIDSLDTHLFCFSPSSLPESEWRPQTSKRSLTQCRLPEYLWPILCLQYLLE